MGLPALRAQSYDKLWKQVEQAQKKSLPQTVIKLADEIYRKAEKEKNAPQMLKAYICKEAYQESLTPDSLYSNLKNMELWAQQEKNPVSKAILHSLLAREYADYMQNNQRVLLSRTALTVDEAPADLREWSSNLLIDKVDEHNRASLQNTARLLEASAKEYVPFVILEDGSRFYQHDMYHLLASRAITTYKDLSAFNVDSLILARIDGIYKEMIDLYRQRPGSEDAVVMCSLDYWEWKVTDGAGNEAYGRFRKQKEQLDKNYLQALNQLIEKYGSREVCAEVYIAKAIYMGNPGLLRLTEVLQICDEGLKRYPSYKRINELRNIKEGVLQPQLRVNIPESIYPGSQFDMQTGYRNLKGFTVNIYSTALTEIPVSEGKEVKKSTGQKKLQTVFSQHYSLIPLPKEGRSPEELPYAFSDTIFKLSAPEATGVYIVQLVPDVKTIDAEEYLIAATRFKVLTLPLQNNKMEVVTLDWLSGQPIADAKVSFYSQYNEQAQTLLSEVTTDPEGKAVIDWNSKIRKYVARKGSDCAMLPQYVFGSRPDRNNTDSKQKHVTLLTDRSLYRPGQTIYVKGIAYEQSSDAAQVLENVTYQLRLLDTNWKELAQKEVRTNDFGSFATEFVLPSVCLNGSFRIEVKGGEGSRFVQVEEYKRPTFEITFQPLAEAYRLGDKVLLKGNVKAFNGSTVQNMPLAYTVQRSSRWNYWDRTQKPMLADTIQTDATGDFTIPLTLTAPADAVGVPDVFVYQVEATVTDEAGETQTASYSVTAGQKAYSFDTRLPQYICKEDTLSFTFGVTNAMNVPLNVKGNYRIYPALDIAKNSSVVADKTALQPIYQGTFVANVPQDCSAWSKLPSGNYRLQLSVGDSRGTEETGDEANNFILFSKKDTRPPVSTSLFCYKENTEFDGQHPAVLLFGTSFKDAYVLMNIFNEQGRIASRMLQLNDTIVRFELPYKEEYGEKARVNFVFVKNGRMHVETVFLEKRQPNQTLDMKWEVFRDRLRPGQKEEWKLVIKTPQGFPAAAEMLATMYDASLDKIFSRNQELKVYYNRYMPYISWNENYVSGRSFFFDFPKKLWEVPVWNFDRFYSPYEGMAKVEMLGGHGISRGNLASDLKIRGVASQKAYVTSSEESEKVANVFDVLVISSQDETLQPIADLRTNFAETAFFYPQLRTNEQGEIAFSFTMPQSLTRWSFRGYSHTKDMMTGMLKATAVTAKEFMLTPNLPRFVRVGDKTQLAAGIANLTPKALKGTATLTLFDPMTEKVIAVQRQKFAVEAGKTTAVNFHFDVTDKYDLLGVRMVADGGMFSDGEQHLLPVLSNKEYITETLAMPIRGNETRTFSLDSLFNGNSRTATDRRLTIEFTGNPAWYAVQSLPVLSQPTTDNAVSWATAFYANSLAGFIANSQPRIKTVFDSWKQTGVTKETFLSQLEKNQEVKNILLSESPWVMEATTAAEQQARIATLFDVNQLNNRNLAAFTKLKELQGEDGAWSWYKGMSGSRDITTYITELLVRLPLMTREALPADAAQLQQNAFNYLHKAALEEYRLIRKAEKGGAKITTISDATMQYLYLVAISGEKVPAQNEAAYHYFLSMVARNLENGTMVCKAQSAIILQKAGRTSESKEFIASIKEHLVQTNEMGAYFASYANPYTWGMFPVSTHVEVMEALRMIGGNEPLVEEMKLWLLKQKQTTSWNSPVATADAVYALLCQGSNLLEDRGDVRITLGNKVLETLSSAKTSVPGLGYIKDTFTQGSPELKAKSVTVEKRNAGIAWGAVYAQYLSPIADVKQQGGELNIEKKLFVERIATDGKKSLQPLTASTPLMIGDKVVSRLTITLDRPMDFVQLKDQRGACFEPIASLSGYRWSNGLGYYVEVEDASTNFFFDRLGKGVHVLENSYRIARDGTYETGLATIQSAYAPEYASHSAGGTILIK